MDENGATDVVVRVTNVDKVIPRCREVVPTSRIDGVTTDVVTSSVPTPRAPTSAPPPSILPRASVTVTSAIEPDAGSIFPTPASASSRRPAVPAIPLHLISPAANTSRLRIPDRTGTITSMIGNATGVTGIVSKASFGQVSLSFDLGASNTCERETADVFLLFLGPFLLRVIPLGPFLVMIPRPVLPPPGPPPAVWDDALAEAVKQ